jgi:hypothetical protein
MNADEREPDLCVRGDSWVESGLMESRMERVFLLWHVHTHESGDDDEKLIGVYRSEDDAKSALERVGKQPGFVDLPEGFQICPYELNVDHWTEGYVTIKHNV